MHGISLRSPRMILTLLFSSFLSASLSLSLANQPSTVPGVSIKNFHFLAKDEGTIYRGGEPTAKQVLEAQQFGINEVIIFKDDSKPEKILKEIEAWKAAGLTESRVHHYPMQWKPTDTSATELCRYTIESLKIIRRALNRDGAKLFFHCSAGEDRTGLLAGMTRILKQKWTAKKAFQEMCAFGYERGNGTKPPAVRTQIRSTLTTLFLELVELSENGELDWTTLDSKVCVGIGRRKSTQNLESWTCP